MFSLGLLAFITLWQTSIRYLLIGETKIENLSKINKFIVVSNCCWLCLPLRQVRLSQSGTRLSPLNIFFTEWLKLEKVN